MPLTTQCTHLVHGSDLIWWRVPNTLLCTTLGLHTLSVELHLDEVPLLDECSMPTFKLFHSWHSSKLMQYNQHLSSIASISVPDWILMHVHSFSQHHDLCYPDALQGQCPSLHSKSQQCFIGTELPQSSYQGGGHALTYRPSLHKPYCSPDATIMIVLSAFWSWPTILHGNHTYVWLHESLVNFPLCFQVHVVSGVSQHGHNRCTHQAQHMYPWSSHTVTVELHLDELLLSLGMIQHAHLYCVSDSLTLLQT